MTVKTQSAYQQSLLVAEKLLAPLVDLMETGASCIPLKGQASDHGELADILEAYARPMLLAAHWLGASGGETLGFTRDKVAQWFREGLAAGTDPAAKTYWGPMTNYHQHGVEMGVVILSWRLLESIFGPHFRLQKKHKSLTGFEPRADAVSTETIISSSACCHYAF